MTREGHDWRPTGAGGKPEVRRFPGRLIMKKLVLAAVLSAFSFSAAAYACDGMKGHEKSEKSDAQAKKDAKKESAKGDQKS
jgi:hypothetical protein